MIYLFDNFRKVQQYLSRRKKIYIFSDFDGTLAAIRNDPDQVRLSRKTASVINLINKLPDVNFIIVSGREMKNLKKHTYAVSADLIALHGFQRETAGVFSAEKINAAERRLLKKVSDKLSGVLNDFPGSRTEEKTYSVVVHYRNIAPSSVSKFVGRIDEAVTRNPGFESLKKLPGKKVIEFIIRRNVTKGTAIRKMMDRDKISRKDTGIILIGDDITDMSMFAEFPDSVSVCVGKKQTNAKYYVKNISEVRNFLILFYGIIR